MRRGHTEAMHSRGYRTYKTKYRTSLNWASYDHALVGRADITLWVSPEAIDIWEPVGIGNARRAVRMYSDMAIETAIGTLRRRVHLALACRSNTF